MEWTWFSLQFNFTFNADSDQGGVLHYDMGIFKNDGVFQVESHLNKPPQILLNAIKLLQSDHDLEKGEMKRYIDDVAEKSTKLRKLKHYRFPGRDHDQLFKKDYPHTGREGCLDCDAGKLVKRLDRESDEPVVHHGLIASGSADMRSAQRRDELRDAWNIRCFEMEAAGLIDDFPCTVIRAVCDYSDDHKHGLWQPYAAVVAASYAKDLLRRILPEEVGSTEAAVKVIKQCMFIFSCENAIV